MSHVTKIYIRYRMNLPATFPLVSSGAEAAEATDQEAKLDLNELVS